MRVANIPFRIRLQTRGFLNFGPGGVYSTKYNIVRPQRLDQDVVHEDLKLYDPAKDELYKETKKTPVFREFLRVLAQKENREEDYENYCSKYAKEGLQVEADVYLTVDELLALMWKNGYDESERNALQFTFPSDYRFHYPELAVMFSLPEEEVYDFVLATRKDKHHIGELAFDKVKPRGLIRNHWLVYFSGIAFLAHFPFFNYTFMFKTFGMGLWIFTNFQLASRSVSKYNFRNALTKKQKTTRHVLEGEKKIASSMKFFEGNRDCLEAVQQFPVYCDNQLESYRQALVQRERLEIEEKIQKQLDTILLHEEAMSASLQDSIVRNLIQAFRDDLKQQKNFDQKALQFGIDQLANEKTDDFIGQFLLKNLQDVAKTDLKNTKTSKNPVVQRVIDDFVSKERDFKNTFYVSKKERNEIQTLTQGKDLNKMTNEEKKKLEQLYGRINQKVGFHLPLESEVRLNSESVDSDSSRYLQLTDERRLSMLKQLRETRLRNFVASFA